MEEKKDVQNQGGTPQPTTAAPQPTAAAPQRTAAAPQKTAAAPQKTAAAPQKNVATPQKTATAPQKTAVADGPIPVGETAPVNGPKQPGENIVVGGKSYKVEKLIGNGSEGDIYVVNDGKHRYALKKCRSGYHTNMKVMPKLQKLNDTHALVEIVDFGDDFEVLEYVPEGSVADANIKGNAEAILAVAVKTAFALDAMHKAGVIHKDIKPANILIKDSGSWDSALCDFGIADVLTEKGSVSTSQTRTVVYAAPEMYAENNVIINPADGLKYCELTPKADFYSLGMTILSLWMGEEKFLQQEQELAMDKKKGRISIPDDMPDPLNKICRGLLIRNPGKRWDLEEIKRTLNNEDVAVEEDELIEDLNITFNAAKHLTANTPEELADCMAEEPELAIKFLYKGQIEQWLKDIYPELAVEMQEIVETRFPKDPQTGVYAAMYALKPNHPFTLSGTSRETGEKMESKCVTLKDVSNFCNDALLDDESIASVNSTLFKEWVRVHDASIVNLFPDSRDSHYPYAYLIRIQLLDPLTDINLRNDPNHPDYAMTGEGIGRFLNKVYNIFYNVCEGELDRIESIWNRKENTPLNRQISASVIEYVSESITRKVDCPYIIEFFNTKGNRFKEQIRFFNYAIDDKSEEYQQKAGPEDALFFYQSAWMKIVKGFGATPEYLFTESGKTVTTVKDALSEKRKTLQNEYENKGLRGFLAVCRMEDPTADLKPKFAYEKLLQQYVGDLEKIDEKMEPVARFNSAVKEAERLLSEGKSKIRTLNARNMAQYILTLLLAVLPAVLLLAMLVFSIIENPLVDTDALHLQNYIWIVGLVLGVGVYILNIGDQEGVGCIPSIIGGVILAVILYFLVKFLGQFILYFYAVVVLAVLVFFSMKTIFSPSVYATRARKFTKPGFEEKVLEPLYFAFTDEEEFDSSLNGAFNDDEMLNWKGDLRVRRIFMFIFIGVVWFLLLFSMLIPKSESFSSFTAPLIERWFGVPLEEETKIEPYLLQPLQKGDKGEEVVKLQTFLREQGYTRSRVDGDFGPSTEKAVKAFQEAAGLEVTGIVDEKTIEEISKVVATANEAKAEEEKEENELVTPVKPAQTAKPESRPRAAEEKKPVETPKQVPKPRPEPQTESAPVQRSTPTQSNVPTVTLDDLIKMTNQNKNP